MWPPTPSEGFLFVEPKPSSDQIGQVPPDSMRISTISIVMLYMFIEKTSFSEYVAIPQTYIRGPLYCLELTEMTLLAMRND